MRRSLVAGGSPRISTRSHDVDGQGELVGDSHRLGGHDGGGRDDRTGRRAAVPSLGSRSASVRGSRVGRRERLLLAPERGGADVAAPRPRRRRGWRGSARPPRSGSRGRRPSSEPVELGAALDAAASPVAGSGAPTQGGFFWAGGALGTAGKLSVAVADAVRLMMVEFPVPVKPVYSVASPPARR